MVPSHFQGTSYLRISKKVSPPIFSGRIHSSSNKTQLFWKFQMEQKPHDPWISLAAQQRHPTKHLCFLVWAAPRIPATATQKRTMSCQSSQSLNWNYNQHFRASRKSKRPAFTYLEQTKAPLPVLPSIITNSSNCFNDFLKECNSFGVRNLIVKQGFVGFRKSSG